MIIKLYFVAYLIMLILGIVITIKLCQTFNILTWNNVESLYFRTDIVFVSMKMKKWHPLN